MTDVITNNLDYAIKNYLVVDGLRFERGCVGFPEEYEIYDDKGVIAYTRLRGGRFSAEYPYISGKEIVYEETGKKLQGMFDDNQERAEYLYKTIECIRKEDAKERANRSEDEYAKFREHFNKEYFSLRNYYGSLTHKISKAQIEKLNNLLGALICHGKDSLDFDYVEDDLITYFIEEFLYSLDNNYRDYLDVKQLYQKKDPVIDGPTLYVKTENEYKSDVEVEMIERDKNDICDVCSCCNCQASRDRYCPGEDLVENGVNCNVCIYARSNKNESKQNLKSNFKRKCDGKFEAVKNWCIECSSFDNITPLVYEFRESRKKTNFKRALKAWRSIYSYIDSFYLEDEEEGDKDAIYTFRYWYWTRDIGKAIEYGLWGVIDYYNIYKPENKEWYWYRRMQTGLFKRQEGDVMPHQHFNLYIRNINQFLDDNKIENAEELKGILERIQKESDIISHWSQNGAYGIVAPGDNLDLNTMPCTVEYYEKIKAICNDFMSFIKKLMKLEDEQDVMNFIGMLNDKILSYRCVDIQI